MFFHKHDCDGQHLLNVHYSHTDVSFILEVTMSSYGRSVWRRTTPTSLLDQSLSADETPEASPWAVGQGSHWDTSKFSCWNNKAEYQKWTDISACSTLCWDRPCQPYNTVVQYPAEQLLMTRLTMRVSGSAIGILWCIICLHGSGCCFKTQARQD